MSVKTYKNTQRQKQANTIKGNGNPNWKGGKITNICIRCGSSFQVYPCRKVTQKHCSLTCANRDMADAQKGIINPRKIHYGEDNGCWNGGKNTYICQWCGGEFKAYAGTVHNYCSKTCTAKANFTGLTGEKSSNWKGGITPINELIRKSPQYREWRDKVFMKDNYTCQQCGNRGCYFEAHHMKAFAQYPELRFDVDNGITLCVPCHNQTKNTNQYTKQS